MKAKRATRNPVPADEGAEVDIPGLSLIREAVANAARKLPKRLTLRHDAFAGLNTAIGNVPDGLANGILVGVNPLYGLYATMMGPFAGGIFSSTQLMIITTTAAASMTTGQALSAFPQAIRERTLFMMVVVIGLIQIVFGLLRFGRLIRFVSYSVITGFLLGISVLLILSQLPTITGFQAPGGTKVAQAVAIFMNPGRIHLWSVGTAAVTWILAILLSRTRLGKVGSFLAIVIPSVLLAFFPVEGVRVVADVGDIPQLVPRPYLPSFLHAVDVITGAAAVAAIILVQGAGVSQSVPNPDGRPSSSSRDFAAQGAANVASGIFHGLPVGGSLSSTALSVLSGANSRWAAIFAGLWMAVILIVLPVPVEHIAMPALGALLVLAGLSGIKPRNLYSVWNAGWQARLASGTTFASTLLLPIQAAVGIGVVLSALLQIYESSSDISVVEQVQDENGNIHEHKPDKQLKSNAITVLDVYGHLYYAGARTFENLLPSPAGSAHPVVILRMRGRTHHDATLSEVLTQYASRIARADGLLYLTGVNEKAFRRVMRNKKLHASGRVRVFAATTMLGESTRQAIADAQAWLRSAGKAKDDEP